MRPPRAVRAAIRLGAIAVAFGAMPAGAQVGVAFVAPDRYTDAGRFEAGTTQAVVLGEIRRLFVDLGARVLGPGESLAIDVLDIDLAGYVNPTVNVPYGLRVVTDATPPRLRLRYVLRRNGRPLRSAEETVGDINFLTLYGGRTSATNLTYERYLIRDWLQARFGGRGPPR